MEQSFEDYAKEVQNVHGNRKHKITRSQNTISGFGYYRKIRPKEKEFVLKDKEYLSIIREMNNLIADYLIENNGSMSEYEEKIEDVIKKIEGEN